jgi:serine protease Do
MLTTKSTRWLFALALILIGVIAGVILTANLNWSNKSRAGSESEARVALEDKMAGMIEFSEGFSAVAEYVIPSVVTVETERTLKIQANDPFGGMDPFGDFFGGDDFFRRFFGPRNNQPQEHRIEGLGSGVIVSEDGYVITNNHVIADVDKIKITLSVGKTYDGKLVGRDPRTDIAVIKIDEKGLPAVKLADSDKIKVGQWVVAIGNPFSKSLSHTVTAGILSGMSRSQLGFDTDVDFLQTDAAINPGNSGGALVNMKGELVGINTAILSSSGGYQGIGFAIPSNTAKNIMEQLIKSGKVIRGYVGISMQDVDEQLARALNLKGSKGALVAQVVKDSPAEKAGLKQGDVIIKVDGKDVEGISNVRKIITSKKPGTEVVFVVIRDGKENNISVTLGEAPTEEIASADENAPNESIKRLGMEVATLNSDLAGKYGLNAGEKGVVITSIDKNGAAFRGGLREGDLIKRVGKDDISNVKDYIALVNTLKPGETGLFLINRKGNSLFIAFTMPK